MSELVDSRCQGCFLTRYQCSVCQQLDKTIKKNYRSRRATERAKPPPFGLGTASPIRLYEPATPVATPVASPVAKVLDRFDSLDASVAVFPAIVESVVNQLNHLSPTRAPQSSDGLQVRSDLNGLRGVNTEFVSPPPGFVSPPPPEFGFPHPSTAGVLFPMSAIPSRPDHPHPPANANSKIASKASAATMLPAKRKDKDLDLTSSGSDSDSDSETGDDDEQLTGYEHNISGKKTSDKKKKMPRISKEERECVCDWIRKLRKDGKMLNGRWVRNGGAKGSTMMATSSEVKTSGAYEALAMCERARAPTLFFCFVKVTCLRSYVNRRLRLPTFVWTKEVAKKRWIAMCVTGFFYLDSNDL